MLGLLFSGRDGGTTTTFQLSANGSSKLDLRSGKERKKAEPA